MQLLCLLSLLFNTNSLSTIIVFLHVAMKIKQKYKNCVNYMWVLAETVTIIWAMYISMYGYVRMYVNISAEASSNFYYL